MRDLAFYSSGNVEGIESEIEADGWRLEYGAETKRVLSECESARLFVYLEKNGRKGWRFETVVEESIVGYFDGAGREAAALDEEAEFGVEVWKKCERRFERRSSFCVHGILY